MSVVAACLPTLAPLFKGGRDPASMIRSVQSKLSLRSISSRMSARGREASPTSREHENEDAKYAWLQLNLNVNHSNDIAFERNAELDRIRTAQPVSNGIFVQKSLKSESDPV